MPNKKIKVKKDYNTVLLEKLDHNFNVFGEVLSHVKNKVDYSAGKADRLEGDMQLVKAELSLIRNEKVNRDEFKLLEQRVLRLEKSQRLTK